MVGGRPRRRLGAAGRAGRPGRAARAGRAVAAGRPGAGVRAAPRRPGPTGRPRRTRSTCPSATSASSSSPRRRSPPAGCCCWRSRGWPPRTSPRCCSPGRSAATCPRPAPCGSAWCPSVALLRIVSAGNVAGEGAKMALLSLRERAAAQALLEEVHYVELSDRADFNDRFVDRLAFPRLSVARAIGVAAVDARCWAPRRRRRRGAIARHVADVAARGWPVDVHPLPPLLHNRPERIAAAVERRVRRAAARGTGEVAVAYADCGTYGALDDVCARLGVRPAAGHRLLRGVRRRRRGCARCSRPSPAPTCSPTTSRRRSTARSSSSSAWTGSRSCATTTSATTAASSGSPSTRPPASARRRSGRRRCVGLPLEEVVVGDVLLEQALHEVIGEELVDG